jgi:hypothetical protein
LCRGPVGHLTGILSFRKLRRIPVYSTDAGGIINGRRRATIRPRSGSVRSATALRVPTLGVGALFTRRDHLNAVTHLHHRNRHRERQHRAFLELGVVRGLRG